MSLLRRVGGTLLRRLGLRRPRYPYAGSPGLGKLSPESVLQISYELLLHREPDTGGKASFLEPLRNGAMSPVQLAETILNSSEWMSGGVRLSELGPSLHGSRSQFVRSLPPAKRIMDLGGTALNTDEGALVVMGYPYEFAELVVVDLPPLDRHEIYQESDVRREVITSLGPVRYRYHSMCDLSGYEDSSFDLVYSGQSIEHVSIADGDQVLREVLRVLRPGGYLALDTPNALVTRLQQPEFIDPDHKYEYTHQEMTEKFRRCGFEILETKGLNYAGRCLAKGRFSLEEVASSRGVFADIENCYLLGYLCRKPQKPAAG